MQLSIFFKAIKGTAIKGTNEAGDRYLFHPLLSFTFHLIYKGFINQWISITRIECYAWAQEGLHIIGKLRIFHLLLHVIDKQLVRWSLVNDKLHIFLVALKDFNNIHVLAL